MIDLHSQLLPAVDDGAPSLVISREMIERARVAGFDTFFTTPHLDGPVTQEHRALVAAA